MTIFRLDDTSSRGRGYLLRLGKRASRTADELLAGVRQRLRQAVPRDWFLLCLGVLLLAFFLTLLIQPTGVGRGGR